MPHVRKTQSLSITLPRRMARMVKDKVKSGAYTTESEVVREGLRNQGQQVILMAVHAAVTGQAHQV